MIRVTTSLIVISAATAVWSPASSASPITAPPGLHAGDQYRLAFVTSSVRNALSPDIADYNAFVTASANSVPALVALGTTWKAIVSTGTVDAINNTDTNVLDTAHDRPIYNLAGQLVTSGDQQLWNPSPPDFLALDNSINITETGAPNNTDVWTGTAPDGTNHPFVGYLGDPLLTPFAGYTTYVGSDSWIYNTFSPFATGGANLSFYALSDVITVVPEPSTITTACLAAIGLANLVVWKRRSETKAVPPTISSRSYWEC